jgi:uncharacterized protein (TIGR03067 family)
MICHALLLGLTGLLLGADAPKSDLDKEYERFRGTWKFVSIETDGMKVPEATFKDATLILDGEKFSYKDANGTVHGTFSVEPAKKPKLIAITFTDGPEKGQTLLGIYDLEGDVYKVCLAVLGKGRPTEFASKQGSGHVLEILKRQKP